MLHVMRKAGIDTMEPLGIVEITPDREYLIVTEFLHDAAEISEAEVTPELIDVGLDTVARLWRAGLAHRDIKPANVMVDAETGDPILTDFGLAKEMEQEGPDLTLSGDVVGTPAYMAPEQAAGRPDDVGPRTDVYALGTVLYDLLCGHPPFLGNKAEILWKVQAAEPASPRKLNPRIHRDLETICEALSDHAGQNLSVEELVFRVRQALAGAGAHR